MNDIRAKLRCIRECLELYDELRPHVLDSVCLDRALYDRTVNKHTDASLALYALERILFPEPTQAQIEAVVGPERIPSHDTPATETEKRAITSATENP